MKECYLVIKITFDESRTNEKAVAAELDSALKVGMDLAFSEIDHGKVDVGEFSLKS